MHPRLSIAAGLLLGLALPAVAEPKITWKKSVLDTKFRSEGVAVADVNKDGKIDANEGQMAYFTPGKDPTAIWEMHPISEPSSPGRSPVPGTFMFSHGLGIGDINGDGRQDVICTGGWWEQPAKDDGKPWN